MKDKIKHILREGTGQEIRLKFDIPIPTDIEQIHVAFKKNKKKLYVVGGAVRDALLKKTPKDFDIATDALPDEVEAMMKKAGFRTLPTGKQFGVINVFTDKGEYEIATFREDIGTGRRPDGGVNFTTIDGDVKRRDLTINALFYDMDTHEVIDLVGGIYDLEHGIIRTVGAPEDRFNEDRLRILRAIRFAGRFGSELDQATDAALMKDSSLKGVSGERIRDEFIKGLKSAKSQQHFLLMLEKYDLLEQIFAGLLFNEPFINQMGSHNYDDYIVLLASLLTPNKIDILRIKLNELKYSAEETKAISFLVAMLSLGVDTAVSLKKAEQHSGVSQQQILDFCKKQKVDRNMLDAFGKFNLSVSGPEAMDKTGLKPGKELGQAIIGMETEIFKNFL